MKEEEEEDGSTGALNPREIIKARGDETLLQHHCQLHPITPAGPLLNPHPS